MLISKNDIQLAFHNAMLQLTCKISPFVTNSVLLELVVSIDDIEVPFYHDTVN